MGEYANMILEGETCQECGVYMGDGDGYPKSCAECKGVSGMDKSGQNQKLKAATASKIPCPTCGKKIKSVGLTNHMRDSHQS